jgi:hypothetical protein
MLPDASDLISRMLAVNVRMAGALPAPGDRIDMAGVLAHAWLASIRAAQLYGVAAAIGKLRRRARVAALERQVLARQAVAAPAPGAADYAALVNAANAENKPHADAAMMGAIKAHIEAFVREVDPEAKGAAGGAGAIGRGGGGGSGGLSVNRLQLCKALALLGLKGGEEAAMRLVEHHRLFEVLDSNASGRVDARELAVVLPLISGGARPLAELDDAALRVVFDLWDKDGNGALNKHELLAMLRTLHVAHAVAGAGVARNIFFMWARAQFASTNSAHSCAIIWLRALAAPLRTVRCPYE